MLPDTTKPDALGQPEPVNQSAGLLANEVSDVEEL